MELFSDTYGEALLEPDALDADFLCEHAMGAWAQSGAANTLLPRSDPLVGFMRHSPQAVQGELTENLKKNEKKKVSDDSPSSSVTPKMPVVPAEPPSRTAKSAEAKALEAASGSSVASLPKKSPYVGFQRHAPPSPPLTFTAPPRRQISGGSCLDFVLEELPDAASSMELFTEQLGDLPGELWCNVMAWLMDVRNVPTLARISRSFAKVVKEPEVWRGTPVRLFGPKVLTAVPPKLSQWLPVWQYSSKLVVPRSRQLLNDIHRLAPRIPVEFSWRFSTYVKGEGVEVAENGYAVRRVDDQELVVLGDAPLPMAVGSKLAPYVEVCLDDRSGVGEQDALNDFGFGVTLCSPEAIEELGSVADEVPSSWVVDFTATSVVLSVNNREAAKGTEISSSDLHEGDRIGLRFLAACVEVYINGLLRETLTPAPEEYVLEGVELYPVLDLYGQCVQISRTSADAPYPSTG